MSGRPIKRTLRERGICRDAEADGRISYSDRQRTSSRRL